MPFTIDKLPDLPVIVLTPANSGMFSEFADIEARILPMFESQTEPCFMIVDMRSVKMGLDMVTQSANDVARDRPRLWDNANLREILVVTPDLLIKLAIQGMSSPVFGGMKMRVFDTPDLAIDYCRQETAVHEAVGKKRSKTG